ncbi:MAG: helix-turn-helix transcriptional regulator [Lachnospiraceae bacterium]|nr:helix-turn-helix transcriptional regulator [Lachnospiraceae bacterium]
MQLIDLDIISGTFAPCEHYTGREVMALLMQQPEPLLRYPQWSKIAQKAQIDLNLDNKAIAERLGYSRQFVTAVINGRKKTPDAIARISKQLDIPQPVDLER